MGEPSQGNTNARIAGCRQLAFYEDLKDSFVLFTKKYGTRVSGIYIYIYTHASAVVDI